MSGDGAGEQRTPLRLHHGERRVLDLLRCGAYIAEVAQLEGVHRSTIDTRLERARRANHCATTQQLIYEYGRSLPGERRAGGDARPA